LCHELLRDARFLRLLPRIDRDLADEKQKERCPRARCGGRLDKARFPRKARGVPEELRAEYSTRESLCCDDCRKRVMPGSVRFLGRRFYVAAAFVVLCAMQYGITDKRVAELRELVGSETLSARTLYRWREWWREMFVATSFWKAARGRFSPPVHADTLPASLLSRFRGDDRDRLIALLRFLVPLSTRTAMPA
jgi:hypothetical protein